MLVTPGRYTGVEIVLVCDANCGKAWGISSRPRIQLSENEDDYTYLSDEELGEAPLNPGTYEGDEPKPILPKDRHNKWCARQCERCVLVVSGTDFELPDFSQQVPNMKWVIE